MKGRKFGMSAVMVAAGIATGFLPASYAAAADGPRADWSDIVAPLLPAVVNITTNGLAVKPHGVSPPEVSRLNGRGLSGSHGAWAPAEVDPFDSSVNTGTGCIIDASGYIVTNAHVIDGASEIIVTMSDNTMFKAKLIGRGYGIDIALLKVESGRPLPALKFGNSDRVRIGDPVAAVGNPLGVGESVSAGIVSALDRDIHVGLFNDFIQTDAAINHGNSGGPLLDRDGEVIGINTAIISPTTGSVGLGFALPAAETQYLVAMLRRVGHVEGGTLGVTWQPVTPPMAQALGFTSANGIIIVAVDGTGPAAGKLQVGDIIVKVDDTPVTDAHLVARHIATAIEKPVMLEIWRDGHKIAPVTITTAREEDTRQTGTGVPRPPPSPTAWAMGWTLSSLSAAARFAHKLGTDQKGVVVTSVDTGSIADLGGIKPGDVILRIQESEVGSAADVNQNLDAVRKRRTQYALVLVDGARDRLWIALPVGAGAM
jgi:serine protease Do